MCLSLETLTSSIKTDLPILVELIDVANSFVIFLCQTTFPRWLTFLLGSQTVILTVVLFWIYFLPVTLCLFYNGFPSIWKFWSCSYLSFHWLSIIFTTGGPVSLQCLWLFSHDLWEMFHGRISLNSVFLLLLVNFVRVFRLEFLYMSHIPHRKYQVGSHSSPWISAACAAAIVHRNHFFVCTKRIDILNLN